VYLPGSFNPLHHGHEQLLDAAASVAGPGVEGAFELSVGNADKVGQAGLACMASIKQTLALAPCVAPVYHKHRRVHVQCTPCRECLLCVCRAVLW
jgi:hypothetical protein